MTIALGLPHTPWVPERVESFGRLLEELCPHSNAQHVQVFNDRESNRVWSQKLWRWGLLTGASHILQLQDDVIVAPNFWAVLRAMLEAVPEQIIGLEAAHPLGREQLRVGRHWYRTRAWLIGVGYVIPRNALSAFMTWCDENPALVEANNEDSLLSHWAATTGRDIWHPVPTIIDHDLGVASTYANDSHYEFSMFRRPTVTWRDVERPAALEDAAWWRITEPPLLPGPGTQRCWFCGEREGHMTSQITGCRLCKRCLASCVAFAIGGGA